MKHLYVLAAGLGLAAALAAGQANAYDPPAASVGLLSGVDFAAAAPLDEGYRMEFVGCDGDAGASKKDHFLGHSLRLSGVPESRQFYLCSRDPSHVKALLKLEDGGIYWHSKMALDVDGSWAAWNGIPGATDLKETSYKWPGYPNSSARAAQIDPDRIPFIVIPLAGLKKLTGTASSSLGKLFAGTTGIGLGDMGVVIHKGLWTPVLVGDGGPFMRLGEGSSRVFEAIGQSRCKKWSSDGQTCVGPGHPVYPYKNFGLGHDVLFIVYPGTASPDITPDNAVATLCAFARRKLGLSGGAMCP
ncbi:chitosanase (glycosyl hydrolase group 75) [Hoeflea marina]|uniref:Chitosanase (Glycosyl hydrolase group 75) n=1 Tax=Hoeflea marina TaxID=274592 RepID=A0A317PM74_9HYPH|nr:glycoside hydrolase family 75 protein [Hoeflea marina]PWW01846.1 chitosanase (glycosyl hydrolase group 75) [Hoeflea marina]